MLRQLKRWVHLKRINPLNNLPFFSSLFIFLFTSGYSISPVQKQKSQEDLRREEIEDYYSKWLEEDVKYIISDEEVDVFKRLQTPEEKEQFIEQFWRRRDPDPRTIENEFKEEHYRRIAYANDHFKSGLAGWKTDRGRTYIIYGPPDEIERHPSGGGYERPIHEGGGGTATYPFEIWFYRHLEGIGEGVELEFVDTTWNEEYKLALSPNEKDVFYNVPGHGMTKAEQLGLATKFQRLQLDMSGANRELYPLKQHRAQDSVFARYEKFAKVKSAPELKHPELKESIDVNISFDPLPVKTGQDFFRLNAEQLLVPVTLQFENRDLSFALENGVQKAKIAVYGVVTSLTGKVVTEFEDDLISAFQPQHFEKGQRGRTLYQKVLILDAGMRYKLDLVAKDVNSGKMGIVRRGIAPPSFKEDQLAFSSLVLADFIQRLPEAPSNEQMFVLGDVKVRPSLEKRFPAEGALGVYLQLYNVGLDQSTYNPSIEVNYQIVKDGQSVLELVDGAGSSVQFFSDQRLVLVKGIPLQKLQEGKYQIQIVVHDRIRNESLTVSDSFQVQRIEQLAGL